MLLIFFICLQCAPVIYLCLILQMLQTVLPSVFEEEDGGEILKEVLKNIKSNVLIHTFCITFIVTDAFIQNSVKPFHEEIIDKKAEEVCYSKLLV